MKQKIDLATASMALGVAGYMVVILDYLARNELGLPRERTALVLHCMNAEASHSFGHGSGKRDSTA